MTSSAPIAAIEQIEKALEVVTHGEWYLAGKMTVRHTSPVGGADGWIGKVNWRNGEANATYIAACSPDVMPGILALARQAEEMKRENAEKDARIAALEAGISDLVEIARQHVPSIPPDGPINAEHQAAYEATGFAFVEIRSRARSLTKGESDAE